MIESAKRSMKARSAALLASIEGRLDRIMQAWLLLAVIGCVLRLLTSPIQGAPDIGTFAPYWLLITAPFVSMVLALRWFARGDRMDQPRTRLAIVGRWQSLTRDEARKRKFYGAGGFMVSLMVGILLNVPVRAMEYLVTIPALAGPVPSWLSVLHLMMTVDVVVMSSLYTIVFVAALRRVPLFPRLLVTVWMLDVAMQLLTAHVVAGTANLPPDVAAALHALLDGNLKKVLISIGLWMPYLLLSKRVNLTYRNRVPA